MHVYSFIKITKEQKIQIFACNTQVKKTITEKKYFEFDQLIDLNKNNK